MSIDTLPIKARRTSLSSLSSFASAIIFSSDKYDCSPRSSLLRCEGSILIVDSTQGVEAQTLANVYQALDINHEIVPVLNKVDLLSLRLASTDHCRGVT